MKKLLTALVLSAVLASCGAALAAENYAYKQDNNPLQFYEDYAFKPGAQLQIYVMGHPDISSPVDNSDSSYVVRPDGKLDFPLIGTVQAVGKTVDEFKQELAERLSEFIIDPKITINVTHWGSTRVFVLGQIHHQGIFSLSRSHRVLDALSAAGGFIGKTAKKRVILIRNGREDNIQELNFNAFLKKGDITQNPILNEGDCIYLTSNHKLSFGSIFSLVTGAISTWNNIDEINDR